MGAVNFSLSPDLVDALAQALPLDVLVETGTFEGETLANLAGRFAEVLSVELSPEYFEGARKRLAHLPNVRLTLGDSREFLRRINPSLAGRSVLYYLDAHWCVADNTAGGHSQCPLVGEIDAIGRLGETSAILIDDARLFLAPPPEPHDVTQWPSFEEVVRALRRTSDRHEIMVLNDVIAFYPPQAREPVTLHARKQGMDWLRAVQAVAENRVLRAEFDAKEAEIRRLEAELAQRQTLIGKLTAAHASKDARIVGLEERCRALASQPGEAGGAREDGAADPQQLEALMNALIAKEAIIKELRTAVDAYRATYAVLGAFIVPLNHLVLGVRSVIRRSARSLAPRLGVLNQHAPLELRLPPHYSRPAPVPRPPKISIVTPAFQHALFIERTIASVLDQGYPNLEYFVQDGGSTDGTREILERHASRLAGWDSTPDSGQAEAINRGFARTTGEIMAYLNSDDILLPGALAYVADFFSRHPEIDVVYGHRILIDEEGRQIGRWMMPAHEDEVLSWADYVPQETLFWRRSIWDKAGGRIDESFRFALDWDLLIRFRDAGARFARLPRFLGGFRVHPQQKTSAGISDIGFQEMDRIRQRVLGRVPSRIEVRKAVFPYLLRHMALDLGWRIRNKLGMHS